MANDPAFQPSTSTVEIEAHASPTAAGPVKARPTLVIATHHEITAAGMETVLNAAGHRVAARCSSEDDLVRTLDALRPNIIMLAENMVGGEPTRMVSRLRACNRSVALIFLLERDAVTASDLLVLDVEGILSIGICATSFIDCVRSVHHGRKWIDPDLLRRLALAERSSPIMRSLTLREADIAHLVTRGLHNKQIARELHLSEGGVKMHLHHIYKKLGLSSRTQLALSLASGIRT
ncbi:response regulator transcription factor [Bradyrhizobium brasilense]|uniref:response regulator transcription factor n=1 Tax=Bradyrhizobium brasilense TaxID=1419277 RepID=UPI001E2863A9|nr:response regulator transcription factor [Bradyrhizobium brasilense]MCC8974672.1 response regulator transcription factor [Bradyrhizobium brasilense]